jgi:hypothetical protein
MKNYEKRYLQQSKKHYDERMTTTRLPLPSKGKINIRHRQMRGVWQCFAGNVYIVGASGDSDNEAAQELVNQYNVEEGAEIIVHGYNQPTTITAPSVNF